jgi:DNA-binding GntR family transcriptional regulator
MTSRSGAVPLSQSLRQQLRSYISQVGERAAAQKLDVSRHTLARALACLALHRGTIALLERGLSSLPRAP